MNIRPFIRLARVALAAGIGVTATAGMASSAHAGDICAPKPKPSIAVGATKGYFYEHESSTIVVTLSNASCTNVSVVVSTSDGTGVAGQDYVSVSKKVTFTPGQTKQFIPVSGFSDSVQEGEKTFWVNLSSPSGGTISWGHIMLIVDGVEAQ